MIDWVLPPTSPIHRPWYCAIESRQFFRRFPPVFVDIGVGIIPYVLPRLRLPGHDVLECPLDDVPTCRLCCLAGLQFVKVPLPSVNGRRCSESGHTGVTSTYGMLMSSTVALRSSDVLSIHGSLMGFLLFGFWIQGKCCGWRVDCIHERLWIHDIRHGKMEALSRTLQHLLHQQYVYW